MFPACPLPAASVVKSELTDDGACEGLMLAEGGSLGEADGSSDGRVLRVGKDEPDEMVTFA